MMLRRLLLVSTAFASLLRAGAAQAQVTQASPIDSVALAKSLYDRAEFVQAAQILDRLLISSRRLTTRSEVGAALLAGYIAVTDPDRPDSSRAASYIERALRVDPLVDLEALGQDYPPDFVAWVGARRAALLRQGELQRLGRLHLLGLPANAVVTLDGEPLSRSDADVASGVHQLRVEAPGYVAFADMVTVEYNRTTQRAIDLRRVPVAPGTVSVATLPWAMTVLDDTLRSASPLFRVSVAPGEHTVRLERFGFVSQVLRFTVSSNTETTLGTTSMQRDSAISLPPPRVPFRSRLENGPEALRRGLWLVDSLRLDRVGSVLDSVVATEPGTGAAVLVLRGVVSAIRGDSTSSIRSFRDAVRSDPTVEIGSDDFNEFVSRLWGSAQHEVLGVSIASFGPSPAIAGRDTLRLVLRSADSMGLGVVLRDALTGTVVWTDSAPSGSMVSFGWSGRPSMGGRTDALRSGDYELAISLVGSSGGRVQAFAQRVGVRTELPDTLSVPGPFPDSLLVNEALGRRARVQSVLRGLAFGIVAVGAQSASGSGWQVGALTADGRAFALGGLIAAAGIFSAFILDPNAIVPERAARNLRARRAWDEERQRRLRSNAERLAEPYRISVQVLP
jgi:hypothetical protein